MCRPEKPITTSNNALRDLQEWLRDQRDRTGQGYRALSVRAGCHATTLQRAASSENVPKLQTVLNYARACDASPDEARRLWKRARYEESRLARGGRSQPAPRPEFIRDFVDLGAALVDLYEKAGSPALRTMEQRAGGYGALPRSTAHRIVNKQAMPHNLPQFQAYLRACEVPEADWPHWETAWTRAWRHEKQDDFASLGTFGLGSSMTQDPWFDTPETIRRETAEILAITKQYDQDLEEDGELYVNRASLLRRVGQVTQHRDPARRLRQRKGRVQRHPSERPVQGQLTFPVGEPAPKADALF
ncbi:helix-turn-helix transcriptional regulator [Streptomyces sp. NPDC048275]|uniref:helix-turn-helix domain-containing protein n=1 Tax=Streptomyces sp. NPDC048275 TaxID=3155629 RepID=UPI0033C955F0